MSYRVGLSVLAAFLLGLYILFQIATRPPEAPEHQVFINGQFLLPVHLAPPPRRFQRLSLKSDRL